MNFTNILFILPALIGVGFLIGFHELGHFLFCKLFNIHTPSFSIGFGPKLISKRIGDTEFSLSAIPLGGYVEIAGAAEVGQGDQEYAQSADDRSFARKPYYQKMLVMFGGIMFNLIFAYTALIALCGLGLPDSKMLYPFNATPTISHIEDGSLASQAGLQAGDTITAFDGQAINGDVFTLVQAMRAAAAKAQEAAADTNAPKIENQITYLRNNEQYTVNVHFGSTSFLGVVFNIAAVPGASLGASIAQGIRMANAYIKNTAYQFVRIFKTFDTTGMGGPIGMIQQTATSATKGFGTFIFLLAVISINLAVLNLIPLPILDGGQILFYTIEAVVGRPLPYQVKEYIHIASWLCILALTLYLTYNDICRMIGITL